MVTDEKYVVFKREEFEMCMAALALEVAGEVVHDIKRRSLPDAVVIRTRDVFAGPALHGYAAGIHLGISVAAHLSSSVRDGRGRSLMSTADYFSERAAEADAFAAAGEAHLPD